MGFFSSVADILIFAFLGRTMLAALCVCACVCVGGAVKLVGGAVRTTHV